jgi:hypothetical protein
MKTQILKGFTMLTLMVALALATAVVSANAQSNPLRANIGFDFVVGDKTLPAGQYFVTPVNAAGDALTIQGADNGKSVIRLSVRTEQDRNKMRAQLVFHRYGQNYFLAEVWSGERTGRELAKSKQERAIERELASIPSKSKLAESAYETVVVVAVLR